MIELGYAPGVPATEWDEAFLQGMVDRMSMSFCKYGLVAEAYPEKADAIGSLLLRLRTYMGQQQFEAACGVALTAPDIRHRREPGNTEYLIDAANFAMIEFMRPRLAGAHYAATDADNSPGRVLATGAVTHAANTVSRENVRRGGSNRTTAGGFYKGEGD